MPGVSPTRVGLPGLAMSRASPTEIPLLIRGNLATPGPKVGPDVFAFLTDPDNRYEPKPPFSGSHSTGRRLALARWITRPGSRPAALLARVLANRIWQHHFGAGLTATSDNLGYSGSLPTHPGCSSFWPRELARRVGVQVAASPDLDFVGISPVECTLRPRAVANRSRQPAAVRIFRSAVSTPRRSVTRMLAASGELDERQGGPYVPTKRNDSGEVVVEESTAGATRRSVYLQQRRTADHQLARGVRCSLDRHHMHSPLSRRRFRCNHSAC